jgi:hypothetical protein
MSVRLPQSALSPGRAEPSKMGALPPAATAVLVDTRRVISMVTKGYAYT